jgi:2,5-furandicarboxylate decarboxylase 1
MSTANVDLDKFRLRNFARRLIEIGEVDIHDEPVAMADLSAIIEATPKATLFKKAGPQQYEMIAAVAGGRRRIAAAFGVDEREIADEYTRRMAKPQTMVEIPPGEAPVQEVVKTGDDIDLTSLPFHLQHQLDGAPYISSAIDYSVDPVTGKRNVGCRRLMLRDRTTMRSNLSQPSDLKGIYVAAVARGERLPVSFAVGSHPIDFLAAAHRYTGDEFSLIGTLRGESVPMVRGVTNGVPAPADAEMIIEGYFDELGYREKEGPYGEFWGFYGPVHDDPVFHVTAITMRKDVLFQTVVHGGRQISRMDSTNLSCITVEAALWKALRAANIEPAAVYAVPSAASRTMARIALKRGGQNGMARVAIAAAFSVVSVRHVTIVDDDIDPTNAEEVDWAMSARYRPDRDTVQASGFPAFYMDPTADDDRLVSKIGFDATAPFGQKDILVNRRPLPPTMKPAPRFQTVRQALEAGPQYFMQIMEALGSDDGREIAMELDRLREEGGLGRLDDGRWQLGGSGGGTSGAH